jgi:hypothetical protein
MVRFDSRLPPKVLKRLGQWKRLGARGMLHTAYVCTLAPTVYSLTNPARNVAAELHRRRVRRSIEYRLKHLESRAANEILESDGAGDRTEFGTDPGQFVQTLEALLDLAADGCAVPSVVAADWTSRAITTKRVAGKRFSELTPGERETSDAITRLEGVLLQIHRAGYALGQVDEDSVLFERGIPIVVDLRGAISLSGLSRLMSVHFRDADRRRFNQLFGTRLLTANRLRKLLSPRATVPHDKVREPFNEVYAPVVIRDDIRWGKIWNTDLGTGRWNFIMKEHLPIPAGGTVLDLGSNNGFNPLQMLRSGARSAVGIEINELAIEQAMFLKSAYEWLDNCLYDFRCIHGSQSDLPSFDLPRFDVVTALCSIYYLGDAEIRDLMRYIRTRTDVLVLQCNTDRLIDRGEGQETFRKASVEYAVEVLEQAGFTDREIVAPPGYSRPLVIGRVSSST